MLTAVSLIALLLPLQAPASRCGAERQAVKTLTDADARSVKLEPKGATVEELIALPAPAFHEDRPRSRVEKTVYVVTATVVGFKLEPGDADYHVVIQGDSGATMIAELPDPGCAKGSVVENEMTNARAAFSEQFGKPMRGVYRRLKTPVRAKVVGVGFFDLLHRQTGVAPNGIELHPVLRVEKITP
jgi:hypothetical protein